MKKRLLIILCAMFFLFVPSVSYAEEASETSIMTLDSGEPGIMPLWSYTNDIILTLGFSGSTAVCELSVNGATIATSIKANLWLYQQNGDGSWTVLTSWKNITVEDNNLDIVRYYNPVYYGQTYKLYFTGKCYGPNGVYYDALAAETIVTR